MTPLVVRALVLVITLAMIAAVEISAQGDNNIVIHNDVEGALRCTVCDMDAHGILTETEACIDVEYLQKFTVNRMDSSPQGYHIACLVGLPRADDGQRISVEGVLVTQGKELKGAYQLSELITGTVKTISMASEDANEDTLLRHLYPKVVGEL